MAKSNYRIKPYKHPRLKFVVRSKISGRWERKFFATKGEAQTYVSLKEAELLNQGKEGVSFSSALRVMAQRGHDQLLPYGKSLQDAVDFFLKYLEATARSVPVSTAITELIENRRLSGASVRYCNDLRLRLGRFGREFSGRNLAEITTAEIDDWLSQLGVAPVTRNTFRRDLRTLFSFGASRRYCSDNPVIQSRKAREIDGDIRILTVEQVKRLLASAVPEMIPFWTIGLFSGLRRAEIERLDWAQIHFNEKTIEVKARHSKTAARRLASIQPNLAGWLRPHRRPEGAVCPQNLRKFIEEDRVRAGLLEDWPQNASRHSFGSYHLAHFNNAAALALQMGNSPDVIFKHYRQLVKPKEAAAYWRIAPNVAGMRPSPRRRAKA